MVYGNEETKCKVFNKEQNKVVKLGRDTKSDIILESYAFSRVHASFFYDENTEKWYIQDGFEGKKSTNGTWIYLDWKWKIEKKLHFRIGKNSLILNEITE